jgi:uncharacterized cupin superfamily protein
MVPEAPIERTANGLVPKGDGWFVLNAKDATWFEHETFGSGTVFEGEPEFEQLGINLNVVMPGQPLCLYHRESDQEDFLVLWGDCLLVVEGEERPLKAWDFVHCPPETDHVLVGAGEGSCGILAVGSRATQEIVYPVSEVAARHGASVEAEATNGKEAYASFGRAVEAPYRGQLDSRG